MAHNANNLLQAFHDLLQFWLGAQNQQAPLAPGANLQPGLLGAPLRPEGRAEQAPEVGGLIGAQGPPAPEAGPLPPLPIQPRAEVVGFPNVIRPIPQRPQNPFAGGRGLPNANWDHLLPAAAEPQRPQAPERPVIQVRRLHRPLLADLFAVNEAIGEEEEPLREETPPAPLAPIPSPSPPTPQELPQRAPSPQLEEESEMEAPVPRDPIYDVPSTSTAPVPIPRIKSEPEDVAEEEGAGPSTSSQVEDSQRLLKRKNEKNGNEGSKLPKLEPSEIKKEIKNEMPTDDSSEAKQESQPPPQKRSNHCACGPEFCILRDRELDRYNLNWVGCENQSCLKWFHVFCVRLNNQRWNDRDEFRCCDGEEGPATKEGREAVNGTIYRKYMGMRRRPRLVSARLIVAPVVPEARANLEPEAGQNQAAPPQAPQNDNNIVVNASQPSTSSSNAPSSSSS